MLYDHDTRTEEDNFSPGQTEPQVQISLEPLCHHIKPSPYKILEVIIGSTTVRSAGIRLEGEGGPDVTGRAIITELPEWSCFQATSRKCLHRVILVDARIY